MLLGPALHAPHLMVLSSIGQNTPPHYPPGPPLLLGTATHGGLTMKLVSRHFLPTKAPVL